ncbi:MAG: hypothetical protein WKI04_06825 [Ferruginibacter sp.]
MKKLFNILTAALLLFSSVVFATGSGKFNENVNARVKASFVKDFSAASNVSWKKIRDCYVATFTVNDTEINAAYNEDGVLVGTSREMETSQLPICVTLALANKYQGYTISQKTLELSFEGITNYYLWAENDRHFVKVKSSITGNIEVENKVKKK